MRKISDVFDKWDTLTAMAADLGENRWTVEKWKSRERIPFTYWPALIRALDRKGYDLTSDKLLAMHSATAQPMPRKSAAACK